MRILVVEDSATLRNYLAKALKRSGYAVDAAENGEDGLAMASEVPYDTVVLDIMLPKLDGLSLLEQLRRRRQEAPVLLLTARDTVDDRVRGLEAGADDYLVKPFAMEELIARVGVLCRRRYARHSSRISAGDLTLDTSTRHVQRGGKVIDLTAREYALLEYLMTRQGEVVSRTDIEAHIYDDMVSPLSNVVDSAIYALRGKLRIDAASPPLIHTRRGQGYVLGAAPDQPGART